MRTVNRRRLTLFHVMFLVGATAVGLFIMRFVHEPPVIPPPPFLFSPFSPQGILWVVCGVIETFWPCAVLWSASLIPLEFLPKRPEEWRLRGRAGIVGCLAISLASLIGLVWTVLALLAAPFGPTRSAAQISVLIPLCAGAGVLAAWWPSWLGRRWRFDTFDWLDTAGVFLGLYWIALLPYNILVFFFTR